ncbi:MAG: S-methyl-5'-thioinosine phosphorylase [Gammaproteobacteria bacterium]|nr:S-methyl-5'-thioinosine phosphorylase [Gammaproteobacteria bacterium]
MSHKKQLTAIIGGTGLTALNNLKNIRDEHLVTLYGKPSSPLSIGTIENTHNKADIVFLARHGVKHNIPPHKVNYRANLAALEHLGVTHIIAVNAVGGIREDMMPGSLVLPDQIIDYTHSRINTFFEDNLNAVTHIDFSYPYSKKLTDIIASIAKQQQIDIIQGATYAVTEGPRLESAAEIQRLKRDGCDIVGMTAMPEAALARELNIEYASICVNANWAAGLSDELITMKMIEKNLDGGLNNVRQILSEVLTLIK